MSDFLLIQHSQIYSSYQSLVRHFSYNKAAAAVASKRSMFPLRAPLGPSISLRSITDATLTLEAPSLDSTKVNPQGPKPRFCPLISSGNSWTFLSRLQHIRILEYLIIYELHKIAHFFFENN